jgi:putative component of membrane protein insertase Oxa1/YidC/SpoIIIJ protein YidD
MSNSFPPKKEIQSKAKVTDSAPPFQLHEVNCRYVQWHHKYNTCKNKVKRFGQICTKTIRLSHARVTRCKPGSHNGFAAQTAKPLAQRLMSTRFDGIS